MSFSRITTLLGWKIKFSVSVILGLSNTLNRFECVDLSPIQFSSFFLGIQDQVMNKVVGRDGGSVSVGSVNR